MRRTVALLALAGLVAASALGAAPAMAPGAAAQWPDGGGHDHGDPAQHEDLGFGAQLVAHLPIGSTIGELDVKTDAAGKVWVLAALTSGGFALIDGTDPAHPALVSQTNAISAYGADAKLSDDSNTVYLGLNSGGANCDLGSLGLTPLVPRKLTCGVQVWDATVKAAPQFIGTLPNPSGTHMLDYEILNGVPTIASTSGYTSFPPGFLAVGANDAPVGVGTFDQGSMHDVTLAMDPLMPGRALALSADGYGHTVTVWDVTVPALPQVLGRWTDPNPRYVHTVHLQVIEGKRVLAAAEECWDQAASASPCTLWFLDATDFGHLTVLGSWANPDGKPSTSWIRFSTHDFGFQDGKLYMGHYHGGLVVLDVSTLASLASPALRANYLPHGPRTGTAICSDVPCVWDAVPFGDVVWLSDINSGVYAVRLA